MDFRAKRIYLNLFMNLDYHCYYWQSSHPNCHCDIRLWLRCPLAPHLSRINEVLPKKWEGSWPHLTAGGANTLLPLASVFG